MREFFIFEVKDEFKQLYEAKPSMLYRIFEQIYYLKKEELQYGYSLFRQLTKKINKEKFDQYFFVKFHQSVPYSKTGNIHYYNNPAHDEISTLEVRRAFLKVKTNYYDSFFLEQLNTLNNNYFACDFKNEDYFFLEMRKLLV